MALFVAIASLVGCTPQLEGPLPPLEIKLPDLIIDSISYRIIPPNDSLGMPALPDIAYMEFTIKIKNIGDASITDPFYIANTKSNLDLTRGYYSKVQIVNQDKRRLNPNETFEVIVLESIDLAPNEPFEVTVLTAVDSDVDRVRFLIVPYSEDYQKDKLPALFPGIEERDYQNNIYELLIR